MGLRLRLKAGFDTSGLPAAGPGRPRGAEALRDDGRRQRLELVRRAARPIRGWSNDDLHTLGRVKGSDFEVVDPASIQP